MSKYVGFQLGKVHESHVISEYYCGGCGWPVTDHDSFCPECGGAFRECDASDLDAENAKLRELLEAVLQCAGETKRDKGCDACPMYNGPWRNDGTWCLLRPTLREVGIEVAE